MASSARQRGGGCTPGDGRVSKIKSARIMGDDLNAKTNTESYFVSDQSDDHSPVNDVPSYNFDKAIERQNRDKHLVDTYDKHLEDTYGQQLLKGNYGGKSFLIFWLRSIVLMK